MKQRLIYILFAATLLQYYSVRAQIPDSVVYAEAIAVTARPSLDSITLRWAPLRLPVWQAALERGYVIERFVLTRNGVMLDRPEKNLLTPTPLKQFPENAWESLVTRNKYAAIAAQALFGDRFEVDLSKTDVFSIVNKIRENEQRFTFALFSADMSPEVARASGLWFTDRNVKKGEKYLYRVSVALAPGSVQSDSTRRGSIFISPEDQYTLPIPYGVKAEFKDHTVSLRWEKTATTPYTAYIVERAVNGKEYTPISDTPLVTVSPSAEIETRYEYAFDSIPDLTNTYSYRVRGVTPFGETSAASEAVSGKGNITVTEVPHITSGENINNKSVRLTWEFPTELNQAVSGFRIERSSQPKGLFAPVSNALIPSSIRTFEDRQPTQINYYRVTARGLDGSLYPSPIYFVPLVDSIPPAAPEGVVGLIDEYGNLTLKWKRNTEPDIYGYRIYRGNFQSEELSQVTSEPVVDSLYRDKINLNTLNEAVYYQVMAIDINQNHSALSPLVKIALPDKLKPEPPVFLPVRSDENGVNLSWLKSSSKDVVQYDVYRKPPESKEWQRIKVISVENVGNDSVYTFTDNNIKAGKRNQYTVTAIDDAGLESDPAAVISSGKIDNELRTAVEWKEPQIDRNKNRVILSWQYDQTEVRFFRVYKRQNNEPEVLYRSISSGENRFTDIQLRPGTEYKYRIMAVFTNGGKSALSKEITLTF